jgi:hypothetical protein
MEKNIIGGVSPLKRKSMRRGKSYGKGKRGAGDTRYKRDKWTPPASGGTMTTPSDKMPSTPSKPYTIDKDGKVVMNTSRTKTDGTPGYWTYKDITTKTEKERSSYQESYDAMEDRGGKKYNKRNDKLYDNFEQYKKEAKAWNEKNKGYKEYEEKTERVKDKFIKGTPSSTTETTTRTEESSSSAGKYRLGGYKAMKNNKK